MLREPWAWKVLQSPPGTLHIHPIPSLVPASSTWAWGCHFNHCTNREPITYKHYDREANYYQKVEGKSMNFVIVGYEHRLGSLCTKTIQVNIVCANMLNFQFDTIGTTIKAKPAVIINAIKNSLGACRLTFNNTASRTNVYKETVLRMNLDVRRFQDTHWLSLLHTPHPHTSSHVTSCSILPIVTETCARHRVLVTCNIHKLYTIS